MKIFVVKGVGIVSVFFICVSILTFCLKTHPDMRVPVIRNTVVHSRLETMMLLRQLSYAIKTQLKAPKAP